MKPEYIGVGNFDEDNYVYAYCNCPLPVDYAIKWPRIKDGKVHSYICTCEDCGTEVGVVSRGRGHKAYFGKNDVLEKIRSEIEQEYKGLRATSADETLELGECLGLKMSLKIIDKYKEGEEK